MEGCSSGLDLSNCTRVAEAGHVVGFGYALIVVWIVIADIATNFDFDRTDGESVDSGKEEC